MQYIYIYYINIYIIYILYIYYIYIYIYIYILPEVFQKFIGSSSHDSFSILHLNIRSIKKNFENFKLFFSTLCFSEIWLDKVGNSLYELPNYINKHQVRDDRKGEGV